MSKIHLKHLVSFSSQDPVYCAANLLENSSNSKPFLCSKDDKSGMLEAVYEFDRASYINYIDIGNCGSCTIEVMVARCTAPRSTENPGGYVSLLPAATFMSLSDVKSGTNRTSVRMFTTDNFNKSAVNEMWDRVKITCCQKFRKDVQFGISFLRLGSKEPSTPKNGVIHSPILQNSNKRLSTLVKNEPVKRLFTSRGQQLVNCSWQNTSQKRKKSDVLHSSSEFQVDALTFLTADYEDNVIGESRSFEEYMSEFERQREKKLTEEEKVDFQMIYSNFVSSSSTRVTEITALDDIDVPALLTNGISSPKNIKNGNSLRNGVSNSHSPQSSPYKKDPHLEKSPRMHKAVFNNYSKHKLHSRLNGGNSIERVKQIRQAQNGRKSPDSAYSHDTPRFDLEVQIDDSSATNGQDLSNGEKQPTNPLEYPTKYKVGFQKPEDFIQFDGSEPTTSSGITYVDCPICSEAFHTAEIEAHAANCGMPEVEIHHSPQNRLVNGHHKEKEKSVHFRDKSHKRTIYSTLIECPVCGNYFDQDEVHGHTNVCIENCHA